MIILSDTLVLSAEEEAFPDGTPWIGWHNAAANVGTFFGTTTTEADGFPANNLGNPATHLSWMGTETVDDEYITIFPNTLEEIDYVGIAKHNFGTGTITLSIEGTDSGESGEPTVAPTSLLHFETGDSPAAFVDSASPPHIWLPQGNATIDGADSAFGSGSGLFDGTGDYITGDGSSDFAMATGDFTIDFRVKFASVATQVNLYDTSANGVTTGNNFIIYKHTGNTLRFFDVNTGTDKITGTTAVTTGVWYHVALTRFSGTTRLFLAGTQEGSSYADSTNYVIGASRPAIGASGGAPGTVSLNGRLDELRIIKGYAAWTANFTPPTAAYVIWQEILQETMPADDRPIIARFTPQVLTQIRIRLQPNGTAPQAAVIYVGKLLVLERSIDINPEHVPITYGRRSNIVNGMSETGNFLGRILLGEFRQSKAEFKWFTPDFYRSDIDEFLEAAQAEPFFWAWQPETYPEEVGYVWLTNNAEPETDPVTRRVALTLEMRGIA